eukprot:4806577-Ditylum_brightwellii.AAC.1
MEGFYHWAKAEVKQDTQIAITNTLQPDATIAILNIPRTNPHYHLSLQLVVPSINPFLVLPILFECCQCACGSIMDMAGNHFFSCCL